ncbi:hypothetical protein JN11_02246 [Mucilaginibacter frigoritolerans]|uniref:Protein-glutamine gamma-glutamyltransferase-like C-terminal domain-containing protein n=1 Tax=Mucilaginibacter frigoritolerans TaxID=652788 RepID=A0A562U1W4_9SPHI|nr:DUF4129 domain-containing protein [Mucilaginibacter frigoritolerans]TWI99831.1 hypothetical protein JN11_02246 [Mucilaginibacter frigoritolerans]
MKRLVIAFLLLLFALCQTSYTHAAAVKKISSGKIFIDTTKVELKKFNAKALDKFRTDKNFNYNGEAVGTPSLWDRFWKWVGQLISGLFKDIPFSGTILKYLALALAIAGLVFIILKSLGLDPIQLWRPNAKKTDVPYSESLENIHEIDFDAEIEKAVSQHNFRLAVRLLYLKCLKQLSDKNLINWQINKTNETYLYELTDPTQKQTFKLLTHQFEYVWYGNFAINGEAFTSINLLFQNFKKQLP